MLGNGDGTFQPGNADTTTGSSSSVTSGDFNADGKLDIAAATDFGVSIYLGNGDGSPRNPITYPGWTSVALVAADFNRDGKLDLAGAERVDSRVSVRFGNGDGTFPSALSGSRAVGTGPAFVATGDFNGDGQPDLAVANSGSNDVSILLGNGNGTFLAAVNYPTRSGPIAVTIADFSGDRQLDLAVAEAGGHSVSILRGTGSGTFQPAVSYAAGGRPNALAAGDFNGDGRSDLAVTNDRNSVWILLGGCLM